MTEDKLIEGQRLVRKIKEIEESIIKLNSGIRTDVEENIVGWAISIVGSYKGVVKPDDAKDILRLMKKEAELDLEVLDKKFKNL